VTRVVLALARRALRNSLRRPQFLAPMLIFPSALMAINVGGLHNTTRLPGFPHVHGFLDFQLAAATLQSTLLTGVSAGVALAIDVEIGFIDRLIAAPVRRSAVVTGRLAATAALGVMGAAWFLSIGLIFGARIEGGVPGALLFVALAALAAMSFGGFGAALALRAGRASTVQGIFPLVFVILFLSSAFFPHSLMLEPASTVAAWNPLSLIVDGLREPVIRGVSLGPTLDALGGIAIVAAVSAALSAWALRFRLRSA
jgi:ABC-type multidrug transport system permease subunit